MDINIDLLKDLASQGYTYSEISAKLNCSVKTVSNYAKKLNLKIAKKIASPNDLDLIKAIKELHTQGLTNKEIAKTLQISPTTARKYTNQLGLETNSSKAKRIKTVDFTEEQLDIIYGGMLGDMCIGKTQNLARLTIGQGGDHEDYFDHLYEKFKNLCGKPLKKERFDKRTKKFYNKFTVKTLAHHKYLELYDLFYINGVKTITKEWINRITPRGIAYWFMDDGSKSGVFATNCFTLSEIQLLQEMFLKRFNIKTRVYNPPKTNQYVLNICADSLTDFENLISPYVINSMRYKLKRLS